LSAGARGRDPSTVAPGKGVRGTGKDPGGENRKKKIDVALKRVKPWIAEEMEWSLKERRLGGRTAKLSV